MGAELLVASWLAVIAIVTLALRREVGLLQARVALAGPNVGDGPEVGALAPRPLRGSGSERRLVLFLSAACPPCHELVADLRAVDLPLAVTAVIPGDEGEVAALVDQLPERTFLVTGDEAQALTARARVRLQPFAMTVEDRIVVGKGFPTGAVWLQDLAERR